MSIYKLKNDEVCLLSCRVKQKQPADFNKYIKNSGVIKLWTMLINEAVITLYSIGLIRPETNSQNEE
jgi:hypothetical protein